MVPMSNRLAIIGVGSNVAPEQHVPTALTALLHKHGTLHLASVVETAPVGMTDDSGVFWNLAVAIPTDAGPGELQAALHDAERAAGRDRDAPGQSWKARPLDLTSCSSPRAAHRGRGDALRAVDPPARR